MDKMLKKWENKKIDYDSRNGAFVQIGNFYRITRNGKTHGEMIDKMISQEGRWEGRRRDWIAESRLNNMELITGSLVEDCLMIHTDGSTISNEQILDTIDLLDMKCEGIKFVVLTRENRNRPLNEFMEIIKL